MAEPNEVDERLGIPKRFLELAAMKGEAPHLVRIGRLVRYRPADILDWIDTNRLDPSIKGGT